MTEPTIYPTALVPTPISPLPQAGATFELDPS